MLVPAGRHLKTSVSWTATGSRRSWAVVRLVGVVGATAIAPIDRSRSALVPWAEVAEAAGIVLIGRSDLVVVPRVVRLVEARGTALQVSPAWATRQGRATIAADIAHFKATIAVATKRKFRRLRVR